LNDAVETLRAVVEAKPSNQEARLYLSLAHKQLGNSTLATETLAGLDHAKLARRGDIKLASRLARQLGLGTANMEVSPPIVNSGENIKSRVLLVVNKIVDYGARLKHGPRIVEPNPIMFFLNLSACLFAIGMRLFYPLIRIRIRGLYGSRIGHMVIENIAYLGERKAGLHGGKRHLNLFYFDGPICNHQFAKMLKKRLPISEFFHQVDSYSSVLPHNKRHYAPIIAKDIYKMRDVEGYMADPTLMNFTPSELRRGWRELAGMGIDRANPYVCFHGRDSAYLKEWRSDIDTSYHDYRDSKIENFLGMANSLIDRGYRVVRMGSAVEQALPAGSEHLIDYATNFRTDFLDIFLMAHCSFMVSGDGGLKHLPVCFGRPLVSVDKVIMHTIETFVNNLLFTPKKIWLISDKRFLSFNEMVNTPVGGFYRTDQYTENGLEVIANSGEDIEAVSLEMDDRLDGKWVPVEEDEELQNRYWSLWDGLWPQVRDRRPSARIGAEFLRRNVDLLN
jgi:putative glycosyltransferase (TIGR04372 family)